MNIGYPEFQKLFVTENVDRLNNIENNILEIEKVGFDRRADEAIMRELHTMKGTAGSFGLPLVADLCHQMEEIFTKGNSWGSEAISEKVKITLGFVDVMRCFFNAKLPSQADEERLRPFLFDLMKDSWTAKPFGSNGIHLRQSESLVIGEMVVIRPRAVQSKMSLDQLHQDLIDMRDGLSNKTLILDLTNLETLPLCTIGWAFALKEELAEDNSRLIIRGLRPGAVSLKLRQKMLASFEVKEKLSEHF